MAKNQTPFNASRKQMWLVQAILAGRKILLSEKKEEILSYTIEDLITADNKHFLDETNPEELNVKDIRRVRFRENNKERKLGELNIINIDYSGQVGYPPALCHNVAEAVRKRKYQKPEFINYLKTFDVEERKNSKRNNENDEPVSKYSFKKEIETPLRFVTDGSLSEKNIYAPLDVFFGKSHLPVEHHEDVTTVQYDKNDAVTGRIIQQALCENNVIYISGPPGTGKTTVLLDTIVSAFLNGKKVLFASKNNAAIEAAYNLFIRFFENNSEGLNVPIPVLRCGNVEVRKEYAVRTLQLCFNRAAEFLKQTEDRENHEIPVKTLNYDTDRKIIQDAMIHRVRQNAISLDLAFKDWREWKEDTVSQKLFNKYQRNIRTLLAAFPIVFSTCDSLPTVCSGDPADPPFDIVIIDEASQCPLSDGLLAVLRAKTLVLAGDMNQLKPVNTVQKSDDKYRQGTWKIDNTYLISDKSLFGVFQSNDPYAFSENRCFRLLNHHRCAPDIIRFSNERYYNGSLCIKTKEKDAPSLSLIDITCHDSTNETELAVVIDLIRKMVGEDLNGTVIKESDIAVISPFRKNHIDKLKALLANSYGDVHVGTIHEFQGSDFRIVILSTGLKARQVNAYEKLIYKNQQLVNVGVTRAKEWFILVNRSSLMKTYSDECKNRKKRDEDENEDENTSEKKSDSAVVKEEMEEENRPRWMIPSVDGLVALHDYVKRYSTDVREVTEPKALDENEKPVNRIDLVESYLKRLLDNRTFNYSGTRKDQKPSAIRINKDGAPDRDGDALKLMVGGKDACIFDTAGENTSDSLKQQCETQQIPYVLLNRKASFSDDVITDVTFSALQRNSLGSGQQCYCGSAWLMNMFLHDPYKPGEVYTDNSREIRCQFAGSDGTDIHLTWYDKCLMDVIYTCFRRGEKTVSAERLIQMISGDYAKRMTKASARDLNSAVDRLGNTRVKLTFSREITMINKHEVIYNAPLLTLTRKSETKFDLSKFDLKTCLPLYALAEERMNIFSVEEKYLKIDHDSQSFSEMKANKIATPNNAFLINRYIYSRINSVRYGVHKKNISINSNNIILFDNTETAENGILQKLGYVDSGRTQSDLNRRSDLRRYVDSLMRWYEESELIVTHYYSGVSTKKLVLSFECQYHSLNEAEFVKGLPNSKSDLDRIAEDFLALDRKIPAEIIYRKFCLGETINHIHLSFIHERIPGWNLTMISRLLYWFPKQIRTYVLPVMEKMLFASDVIAQDQIQIEDKSNKHILQDQKINAVCSAGSSKPHIVIYRLEGRYPYIPKKYAGSLILSEIPEELSENARNRVFQNWNVFLAASHKNIENLRKQKEEGKRKAAKQYQLAIELNLFIEQIIRAVENNAWENSNDILKFIKNNIDTANEATGNLMTKIFETRQYRPGFWQSDVYMNTLTRSEGAWVINSEKDVSASLALYSVIQSLKLNQIDIKEYLQYIYDIFFDSILVGGSDKDKRKSIEKSICKLLDNISNQESDIRK